MLWAISSCSSAGSPPPEAPTQELPPAPEMIPDPTPVIPDVTVEAPQTRTQDSLRVNALMLKVNAQASDSIGLSRAIGVLQDVLAIDSLHRDALWQLGWKSQQLSRWDDALDAWSRLVRLDSTHTDVRRYVPIVEMRRDRDANRAQGGRPLVETQPRAGESITVAAVGDIQLGTSWPENAPRLPPNMARDMFTNVAPMLRHPDVTFGNLETVLADSGASTKCRSGSANCYAFRAPTAFAHTLKSVGFDILSVNNNHASDFGAFGARSTVAALDAAGVLSSGSVNGLASWEVRGLKIALLAFSTGDGPFKVQDVDGARRAILEADQTHDLVFVSFHGGAEGSGATRVPRAVERAYGEDRGDVFLFARTLVDAGADLILGHGPHVLRGMEIYRERLIAYSLGNFSAWHGFNLRGPSGISAILQVTLAPNGVITDATINPIFLDPPGIPTPDPANRGISIIRELSELDFGASLFDPSGRLLKPVRN